MNAADLLAVGRSLMRLRDAGVKARSAIVFSPYLDLSGGGLTERTAIEAAWPRVSIAELDRCQWDLDGPMPADVRRADLGIICNTFMCSRDPALWLRNLSAAVPLLVVQDLAVCRRAGSLHCSVETGDVARYSVSSHGIMGETDPDGLPVFDLSACGYGLLDVEPYEDGGGLKFVATLRLR